MTVPHWSWGTWDFDLFTILWTVWIVYFIALESITLMTGSGEELTEHLRPLFHSAPVLWFLAAGLWMWLGVHFLVPPFENVIARAGG